MRPLPSIPCSSNNSTSFDIPLNVPLSVYPNPLPVYTPQLARVSHVPEEEESADIEATEVVAGAATKRVSFSPVVTTIPPSQYISGGQDEVRTSSARILARWQEQHQKNRGGHVRDTRVFWEAFSAEVKSTANGNNSPSRFIPSSVFATRRDEPKAIEPEPRRSKWFNALPQAVSNRWTRQEQPRLDHVRTNPHPSCYACSLTDVYKKADQDTAKETVQNSRKTNGAHHAIRNFATGLEMEVKTTRLLRQLRCILESIRYLSTFLYILEYIYIYICHHPATYIQPGHEIVWPSYLVWMTVCRLSVSSTSLLAYAVATANMWANR